ncbi:uncharacterized protein [Aegilops tauschii subsp. strangulata]|uniref:uncharacterized protein n=1 Tax=Aegilops tauschii subsp. strangulata TaxID=200361 RepID=UPI003CC8520B
MAAATACSDHCPLILATCNASIRRARFRFESLWPKFLHFHTTVERAWNGPVQQRCGFAHLQIKLSRVAHDLKIWSRSLFSDVKTQFHIAREVILRLDVAQETRTLSEAEYKQRKLLKIGLVGLAAIERARRRQASRVLWLRAGDASTKFFHAKCCSKRRKNFIHTIQSDDQCATAHGDKAQIIHDHFSKVMTADTGRRVTLNWSALELPRIQAAGLDNPFKEGEVWAAIMQSPTEKAPGPDGFSGTFFRACWSIISNDIMADFH